MRHPWILGFLLIACSPVSAPAPYGACPSKAQIEWQKREMIMFYHFGQATFSGWDGENPTCNGKPWSAKLLLENYTPSTLDPSQWVRVAADNGFKEVILTAKHHDGFCLWDNPESTADIANPLCKNPLDVVQAVRDACNQYGLALGLYLSPWDRTIEETGLGIDVYEPMYKRSLKDLMRRYAPVVEFWIDGNHAASFDWPSVHQAILEENPDCIVFSDAGPGCRWVGNEAGKAGETNWCTLDVDGRSLTPGHAPGDYHTYLAQGDKGASRWVPAECDFSIQDIGDPDGWFYDPSDHVKTAAELLEIYYTSVGRGGVFLMNVPPSRDGVIAPAEVAAIEEFTALREKIFGTDLAEGARVKASALRGKGFEPARLLDGDYDSCYAAPDGVTEVELEVTLDGEKSFNLLQLQEYIPLGQRVESFSVQVRENGAWHPWADGTTIGYKRILKGAPVKADALRIQLHALASPVLNSLSLYSE